jgi:archaellum component FlaF (FlaF/FlaG flagellin family)
LCWNTRTHQIIGFAEEEMDLESLLQIETEKLNQQSDQETQSNTQCKMYHRDDSDSESCRSCAQKAGNRLQTPKKKVMLDGTYIATHINQFLLAHESSSFSYPLTLFPSFDSVSVKA